MKKIQKCCRCEKKTVNTFPMTATDKNGAWIEQLYCCSKCYKKWGELYRKEIKRKDKRISTIRFWRHLFWDVFLGDRKEVVHFD